MFSESEILLQFNVRREARVQHPGLCSEEYQRMMELVIKHLFKVVVEGRGDSESRNLQNRI
jgi:hypothetical protein